MGEIERTERGPLSNLAWYWLPLLAWMGIIYYLSARPDLPNASNQWLATLLTNCAHFGVYAVLAYWWWRALAQRRSTNKTLLGFAFAASLIYAVSDEFHQSFVIGRDASTWDVLVDAAGSAFALWLIWRWQVRH